jgi:hypothetical protein
MATMERVWQFDINRAFVPVSVLDCARYIQWYVKAFLKGEIGGALAGLWTCLGSSDGVTAALDGLDRWGTPYNGAKIVRAAPGVAHSWIVLKSPTMNGADWYLTIDCSAATDNATRWVFSKAAPTGGTTLVRPTATDEWYPGPTLADVDTGAVNAPVKLHGGLTTGGSAYVLKSTDASGIFSFSLLVQAVGNQRAGDLYPLWTDVQASTGARGVLYVGTGYTPTLIDWSVNNAHGYGRSSNGAALRACIPYAPGGEGAGSPTLMKCQGADSADATYSDVPMWILVTSASAGYWSSVRGRLVDFAFSVCDALPIGSVEPIVGATTSMIVGHLWVPSNAIPLL